MAVDKAVNYFRRMALTFLYTIVNCDAVIAIHIPCTHCKVKHAHNAFYDFIQFTHKIG